MNKVPQLRFSEFIDEWERKSVQNLFLHVCEKNHPERTVLTIMQGFGTMPRDQAGRNISFNLDSVGTYKLVNKHDLIIHLRSFEGGLEIANEDGIVSPAYTILRANENVSPLFYKQYFRTKKFIGSILSKAVEGIRDGRQISYNQLKWLKIPTTSLPEQTKIADFLSLFDERIEKQKTMVENLKQQKKGLMQKLFSRQIRFKDDNGNAYPDWEEKRLGDVSYYKSSNITMSSLEEFRGDACYPIYNANKIYKYIDSFECGEKYISIIKDGAGVGRIILCNEKSSVIGTMGYIINNKNTIIKFLYHQLPLIDFNKYITGSTIPHLYYKDYKSEKIKLPCILEQQKIADVLSCFDKKVETETAILDKMREYKKGLLQQMFV